MPRTDFERLEVYQLSERLADEVWDVVKRWEPFAKRAVGGQLVRAADSVGANIAEGVGRGSYQDNRRFVRFARGSLYETKHWLRRAYRRRLLNAQEVERLKTILDELSPRLNAYLKSIGPTSTAHDPPAPYDATDHEPLTTDREQLTTDH